ncbi:amino acid permease 2-like [Acanthaster planci]|uniref:Amino acid permease 2-like n=1 Tax=Acanthaster planci TaxID=133434 RepID=A0A8B7XZ41_ACAPL|nr:amino acid permease 2-like [Acanthaster planci]XP_022085036.1 amino acid permease 2-like [Acanthaster planci]
MDQPKAADKIPLMLEEHASYGDRDATPPDNGDQDDQEEPKGLTFWQTFFAGSGIISGFSVTVLMTVIIYTGWLLGITIYVVVVLLLTYTGTLLGNCWEMIGKNCRDDRHPYGAIADQACGKIARMAINTVVDLNIFTANVMMLLIIPDLLYIIAGPSVHGTFCYWPLAFGLIVLPFMWLGALKDLWQLGAISYLGCCLAMVFLLINGARQIPKSLGWRQHPFNQWNVSLDTRDNDPPSFYLGWLVSLVFSTSLFMVSFHFAIPSIQRGMHRPQTFNKCLVTIYSVFSLISIPTLLVVFFGFGHLFANFKDSGVSILYIMPRDDMVITPAFLLLVNSLMLMVPASNPLFQHYEEILNIPEECGWKRLVFRTLVVLLEIFFAETIPQFSVFIAILSGLFIPPLTFLAPALFYLRLRTMHRADSSSTRPFHHMCETVACVVLIVASPVVMVLTIVITSEAIADGDTLFVAPCYVDPKAAHV